ncbi:DNA polymerase III, subunit gamma and tau [Candidatus Woesebacteria bacterium RBG_16_36_11]|uniref:DNA polymerase III subunit gamma/tau n=3 Tax=Candidatus Woeseibacteriota TaxID=1752722 RepID=A0A1F7XBS5_9BACT|nr:MAG: DNA polymerase III, subunit gamma and tau [Candidatus Woesebacteria bacterium RBG_13_36_22]OGM12470.1 MAG: DNA polymerase III, subunit gamma and tau [Candidatus Woesebacteria bacterium RBG_16_36_11]OGM17351.1 MAG: DNA polymerase III, subunit gamma and tau [Candidatus Woesebacteria bacterium RBG_19FT_COMBO_37_29]
MTFYLKYRPKTLDDLDSESVRESLKKIVSSGNIPQAFLFTGPKGIGKTSAARILASIVNCENIGKRITPCEKCEQCKAIAKGSNIDVIEMDAASHRGIDDVRIIRDAVKLSPAKARKKVYIIDEAHMLTVEAANALLKTLEEPPQHVMFILATTNPEKIIDTIRSRTTIINFNKATPNEIERSLKKIVTGEKIKMDDEALTLITKYSEGSFRDAAKILEQLVSEKIKGNYEDIENFLSISLPSNITNLLNSIIKRELNNALSEVEKLSKKGTSARSLIEKLIERFRIGLLGKMGIGEDTLTEITQKDLMRLIELLIKANKDLPDAYIEELPLEIAIIKWCQKDDRKELKEESDNSFTVKEEKKETTKTVSTNLHQIDKIMTNNVKEISGDIWNKILAQVKIINMSVEALLRAAKPMNFDGKTLTLGVYYRFHKERLEDLRNRKILEEVVEKVLSIPTKVVCILTEAPVKKEEKKEKIDVLLTESEEGDIVKAAKDIFGN